MRLVHRLIGEEDVIGGDQRQIVRIGEIEQPALDRRSSASPWRMSST